MAKKVKREIPEDVFTNYHRRVYAITDKLELHLRNISKDSKGDIVYTYEYIDERGPTGRRNTKYKTSLSLTSNELADGVQKSIFKILPVHYHILIERDFSCKMARVKLDDKYIMEGNFWDFHPGCHGINQYGDFQRYNELATRLYQWLLKTGRAKYNQVKTTIQPYDWKKENYAHQHTTEHD